MEPMELEQSAQTAILVFNLLSLALVGVFVASTWKIFSKANIPGWHCLIPILNIVQMCRVAGKSGAFAILMFIPLVNFVASIFLTIGLAKNFGKSTGFAIGMLFLPLPFYPMLAFDGSRYVGNTPPPNAHSQSPSPVSSSHTQASSQGQLPVRQDGPQPSENASSVQRKAA